MFTTDNFKDLAEVTEKVCLAIGVFDGVHRGHQKVISQAVSDAKKCDGDSVVLTFDPHPARVLRPDKAPPLLTSTQHKLKLIEELGASACLVLKFDRELANTAPEVFIERIFQSVNELQEICVGFQWCFGKDRKGTVALIERMGQQHEFAVKEMQPVTVGTEVVSSTLIRRAVAEGDLANAGKMLGRPFSILGTVEQGDKRGRDLGFPTANLNPHNEILPPNGVYAVRARIYEPSKDARKLGVTTGEIFKGALNIGVRPTVQAAKPKLTVEVHLFDFFQNLYGSSVEVFVEKKIRDEKKFESLDALKQQIAADCETAKRMLATNKHE